MEIPSGRAENGSLRAPADPGFAHRPLRLLAPWQSLGAAAGLFLPALQLGAIVIYHYLA